MLFSCCCNYRNVDKAKNILLSGIRKWRGVRAIGGIKRIRFRE
ncbi:hypothetical protein G0R84_003898 [Salmonella enterica]|nr:hypothetical protein [Salmonella enterica]